MSIARSSNACSKFLPAKGLHRTNSYHRYFYVVYVQVCDRILKLTDFSKSAVTVVESGTKALQYLGLDGEENSIGFKVSKSHGKFSALLLDLGERRQKIYS